MMILFSRNIKHRLPDDFFGRAHAMTGQPEVVDDLVTKIKSLDGNCWVPAWVNEAKKWESAAADALHRGDHRSQIESLRRASAFYSIASYPRLKDEQRKNAYRSVLKLYKKASRLEGAPVRRLEIPYNDAVLYVYVRQKANVPLQRTVILFIRGLDSTKEVTYWDESELLSLGYTLVSIDFPGMGENVCAMELNSEKLFQTVLDALAPGGRYSGLNLHIDQTVAWGMGFGGYWAYKLAAVDRRVCAAINIGGPVHHAFSPGLLSYLKRFKEIVFLKEITLAALGPSFKGSLSSFIKKLSLVDNGLIYKITTPLLYINGRYDQAVPAVSEAKVIKFACPGRGKNNRKAVIYQDAGHLAIEHINSKVIPLCIEWLQSISQNSINNKSSFSP